MEDVKIVNTVNLLVAAGNGAVHGITHWKTRINSEIAIAIKNAIKAIAYRRKGCHRAAFSSVSKFPIERCLCRNNTDIFTPIDILPEICKEFIRDNLKVIGF